MAELLTRAIAREGKQTGYWDKARFWVDAPSPQFAGADDPTPSIEMILSQLTSYDLQDPEVRALAAAAGNFVWGQPAYQLPAADRQRIIDKVRNRQPLSDAERLYVLTSQIDTDMF